MAATTVEPKTDSDANTCLLLEITGDLILRDTGSDQVEAS